MLRGNQSRRAALRLYHDQGGSDGPAWQPGRYTERVTVEQRASTLERADRWVP